MLLRSELNNGVAVVSLNIRTATIKETKRFMVYLQEYIEKPNQKLLIDCSQVQFMDSAFVGTLVQAYKKSYANNGDLRVVLPELESPVYTIFGLIKLNGVLKIYKSLSEGIVSFNEIVNIKSAAI